MKTFAITFTFFALSLFAIGCENTSSSKPGTEKTAGSDDGHDHGAEGHDGHDHAAHDHSTKYGGQLIELGRNHEYHAELVDDHKTETITVHMMDNHMEPLVVKQPSISLVLTVGEQTTTFELPGANPEGSTEFSSSDETMMSMIDAKAVKGKLRVTIDGKPFTGTFDHHDHEH